MQGDATQGCGYAGTLLDVCLDFCLVERRAPPLCALLMEHARGYMSMLVGCVPFW